MSVQSALVAIKTADATLNTLVGTRFHPDTLPQGVSLPCVTFQVVSRTRDYVFGSTLPTLADVRVQIDGYAASSIDRSTLASALRGAFQRYSGTIGGETISDIRVVTEMEMIEQLDTETEAYRIMLDCVVNIVE